MKCVICKKDPSALYALTYAARKMGLCKECAKKVSSKLYTLEEAELELLRRML